MKGFLGLVLLVIVVLFVIQNLQAVSLVFFGSQPITLPLSIWVVLFAMAGILVSIIIQLLTKSNSASSKPQVKQQNTPYPNPPQPYKYNEVKPQLNKKVEPIEETNNFTPTYREPYDQDFEFLEPKNTLENQEKYPEETPSQPQKRDEVIFSETNPDLIQQEIPEVKINPDSETSSNNHDNNNLDLLTKPRSPSLYSYQPREKTQIRRKSETPKEVTPIPKNEVYDANYRILKSSSQPTSRRDDYQEDEEEWDF